MRELIAKVDEKGNLKLEGDKFAVGELRRIGQAIIQAAEGVMVEFKQNED